MRQASKLSLAVACGLGAMSATAADVEALSFNLGPFRAIPTLGLTFSNESNVLRSQTNEIDSFVVTVSPGIRLERGDAQSGVIFGYEAEVIRYLDVSSENAEDHRVYAQVRSSPSARVRMGGTAEYARGHDNRGESGAQQGPFINLARDPDEYGLTTLKADLEFGAPGARALVAGDVSWSDLSYRNNREFTQFRDSQEFGFGGLFGLRVGGKTRLTLSAHQRDIEFDRQRTFTNPFTGATQTLNYDSQERDLMVGVLFEATGKTTGRAEIGRIEKDFDSPVLDDFSGTGWTVGVTYSPTLRSAIDVSASRQATESDMQLANSVGAQPSFSVTRDFTAAWSYAWTERVNFSLDGGFGTTSYRSPLDSGLVLREDDLRFFGVGVDYKFRRWLQLGAGYKNYERDSDDGLFDYDRDVFTISVEGTL